MNFVLLLMLAAPQVMLDQRFEDFRLPTTRTSSWSFSFSPGGQIAGGSQEFGLPAEAGYSTYLDGDTLFHSFGVRASTDLWTHSDSAVGTQSQRDLLLTAWDELNAYPFNVPLLVGLSAGTRVDFGADNVQRDYAILPVRNRDVSLALEPRLGAGRLRDARPVVQALWIEEVLKQEGILDRDLRESELQQLARLVTTEAMYSRLHDHGERYFFQTLEDRLRPLARSPAIPARVWLRVKEVLRHYGEPVETGFQVAAGLRNDWFFNHDRTACPESVVTRDTASRYSHFSFTVKSGHPFTPHLRFTQSFEYNLPLHPDEPWPSLTTDVGLIYEVNDIWLVQAEWFGAYSSYSGPDECEAAQGTGEEWYGPKYDYLSHGPSASLSYFSSDHLRVTAGARLSLFSYRTGRYSTARTTDAELDVRFDVTWRP